MENLLSGGPETYLLLFGVLIVVFTLIIFKMTKASWAGLGASFFISVLLTALAFYVVNPSYGLTLLFWLAIGLGAMGVLYFSKTWSGFAASLIVAGAVIALVFYFTNPKYGLWIAISYVVALVLIGLMAVKIYSMKQGYSHRKQDKVTVRVQHPDGRVLTAVATRGAFTGPSTNDPALADPFMEALGAYASTQSLSPGERARQLMLQPGYVEVLPVIDDDTAREVKKLEKKVGR
ncbi:hypothetical protein A3K29_05750 [Candidatus Collierbacteria bacterium RIFOXYB2_FULL_46_14]|nr:MAG: hypothetical protein A3K29_05750 [Candidatus Collierbacteria bacterium RIFOXYB2_FULL_46_14]OGD76635.1 MAG: hypothetical protein A3K43_05750 [Candidatus Collierbacteria bacterium RIFOXYA2_FULL_46_20]OGD77971.1 MAG: hypothetical protein A3K39_05750 [Candidatus Collierbacteria bacterium RIFOXYC2_FULL_43_15]OGD79995.1 MAG: hypothetical protein A2320_00180 [Pseudomonadales bacterium GWC2_63_15]OGD82693.1 MAG: hypothetical protein A3K36_05750 [Candidatus Collierbacteria bacterium RIFOXYD2_FUL